jgi:hypothetical protein
MPSWAKSLANDALKPSPAPTISAVLYFAVSMNILRAIPEQSNCSNRIQFAYLVPCLSRYSPRASVLHKQKHFDGLAVFCFVLDHSAQGSRHQRMFHNLG